MGTCLSAWYMMANHVASEAPDLFPIRLPLPPYPHATNHLVSGRHTWFLDTPGDLAYLVTNLPKWVHERERGGGGGRRERERERETDRQTKAYRDKRVCTRTRADIHTLAHGVCVCLFARALLQTQAPTRS